MSRESKYRQIPSMPGQIQNLNLNEIVRQVMERIYAEQGRRGPGERFDSLNVKADDRRTPLRFRGQGARGAGAIGFSGGQNASMYSAKGAYINDNGTWIAEDTTAVIMEFNRDSSTPRMFRNTGLTVGGAFQPTPVGWIALGESDGAVSPDASAGDTVVSETTWGQAATAGTGTKYSRLDHTHGTQTFPFSAADNDVLTWDTATQMAVGGQWAITAAGDYVPYVTNSYDIGTQALALADINMRGTIWKYGNFVDTSNYSRVTLSHTGDHFYLTTFKTGTPGNPRLYVGTGSGGSHLYIQTAGTTRFIFQQSGTYFAPTNDDSADSGQPSLRWAKTHTVDLDVHGDQVFKGSGLGLPHASFYGNDIAWSQASAAQNTWYDISDADIADGSGGLNNFTHDGNGKLTAGLAGGYVISYDVDCEVNTANKQIETGIAVNGTEVSDGRAHADFPTANAARSMGSVAHVTLAANDTVNLSIRTTSTGTPDITVDHVNLVIFQVSG